MVASAPEPQPLVRDVLLRDGSTLRLQSPTPVDFDDIKALYDGLSPDSRYLRFHGFGRTDTVARADAEASGVDRLALISRQDGRVVAVASYDGLREPGVAEVAFAVADDDQRRGIGMRMLEQLAAIAADRGIHRFDAEVMANNAPMLGVFEHAGFAVRRRGSFGELTVSLDITPTEAVLERIGERDHFAAMASLRPVLAPSSVAVVGAAATPGNVGWAVLANMIAGGFEGVVTPVNRAGGVVCSMRAARSLAELEVAPELVIIAAAGDEVLEFAAEAAAKGARALLILPAGPEQEGGEASLAREERLLEIVRGAGLRMVGPSSLGVLNTAAEVSLNATFTGASVRTGALAICSPSGAVGIGLLGHAAARQLGVSMFASLGNRADVSTNDLLECWEEDERTAAVVLYVESFGSPERFTRIARRVSRSKPILAVKGRRRAERVLSEARSHTAAALRGEAAVDALLYQAGVLRFRGGEELFDAAEFFERQPLPSGRRIGIVSSSAGVATLAADACATRGLEVREASEAQNPLVLGISAGPDEYAASIRELLGDAGIDALMVFYVDFYDGDPDAVLDAISAVSEGQPKPVVASVLRADGRLPARTGLGVPNFLFPESCAAVLARAAERREWLSRPLGEPPHYRDLDGPAARAVISSFLDREPEGGWLSLAEAEALLATHGIPFGASHRCRDVERAVAVAAEIGAPVALKADFAAPAHASDIDAVMLGLEDESAVRSGWRELERRVHAAGREWMGAIVQRLIAPGGADVLVGAVGDPDLGPVLAVGFGGRRAGLGRTAAFRLLPVTDTEADELIDSAEGVATQLNGFRGSAVLDRQALRELMLRFALLLRELPEVVETDLNPVRCMTSGCVVLDARLRIEHRRPVERVKTW
ncbi:MAG TPA: GNAT family N-acetyltransferase [Thermoleophilaceae bacterium]|nr:GNAT family N-acetyltransferase [Thermoleophilaceae bacterium]